MSAFLSNARENGGAHERQRIRRNGLSPRKIAGLCNEGLWTYCRFRSSVTFTSSHPVPAIETDGYQKKWRSPPGGLYFLLSRFPYSSDPTSSRVSLHVLFPSSNKI